MYRIVNWAEYNRLKNEEDRREYNRVKQAEFRQNRKRGLGLTEAQVLERLDKLKGRELAPGELSAELREIHGDMEIEERASGGAYTPVQLRRIARLKAKIAREEALEEAVKKSWNPDCAPRTESEKVKLPPGVTMCESIQKKVKEDPITIADQAAVAMKSGSALLNEPGEMTGLKSEELRDQESLP